MLETPESCIKHNVSRNAKRDGLKMIQIGQSAAKPLSEKSYGEGSETMHVASHGDDDIVQTTTSQDGHGDME